MKDAIAILRRSLIPDGTKLLDCGYNDGLLKAIGVLEVSGPEQGAARGEEPLNEFETKRILAAADILESDEYDGKAVAALIRRLVARAALRSAHQGVGRETVRDLLA